MYCIYISICHIHDTRVQPECCLRRHHIVSRPVCWIKSEIRCICDNLFSLTIKLGKSRLRFTFFFCGFKGYHYLWESYTLIFLCNKVIKQSTLNSLCSMILWDNFAQKRNVYIIMEMFCLKRGFWHSTT